MPRVGFEDTETRTEGERDRMIPVSRRTILDIRVNEPQDTLYDTKIAPDSRPRANVQGATRQWMRIGGKQSMERLREIEWL